MDLINSTMIMRGTFFQRMVPGNHSIITGFITTLNPLEEGIQYLFHRDIGIYDFPDGAPNLNVLETDHKYDRPNHLLKMPVWNVVDHPDFMTVRFIRVDEKNYLLYGPNRNKQFFKTNQSDAFFEQKHRFSRVGPIITQVNNDITTRGETINSIFQFPVWTSQDYENVSIQPHPLAFKNFMSKFTGIKKALVNNEMTIEQARTHFTEEEWMHNGDIVKTVVNDDDYNKFMKTLYNECDPEYKIVQTRDEWEMQNERARRIVRMMNDNEKTPGIR